LAPAPPSGYAGLRAPGGSRGSPRVPGASVVGRSRRAVGGRCILQDDRYPRQPRVTIANGLDTKKGHSGHPEGHPEGPCVAYRVLGILSGTRWMQSLHHVIPRMSVMYTGSAPQPSQVSVIATPLRLV